MCQKENPKATKTFSLSRALTAFRTADVACLVVERREKLAVTMERRIRGSSVALESLQTSIDLFEEQLANNRPYCAFDRKRMEEHHVDLLVQKSAMLSHHASIQRALIDVRVSREAKESLFKQRGLLAKELLQFSIQGCHIEHRRQTASSQLNNERVTQSLWHSAAQHLSLAVSEIDLSIFCDKAMGGHRSRAPQTDAASEEHMERAMLLILAAGKMLHLDTATVLDLFTAKAPLDTPRKKALFLSVRACLDDLQAIVSRRDQQVCDLEEHVEHLDFEALEHCRELVTHHL